MSSIRVALFYIAVLTALVLIIVGACAALRRGDFGELIAYVRALLALVRVMSPVAIEHEGDNL